MAPAGGEAWKQELEQLRARLDRLEQGQKEMFAELRQKLSELEPGPLPSQTPVPEELEEKAVVSSEVDPDPPAPPPLPPAPSPVPVCLPAPVPARTDDGTDGGFEMQLGRVWLVRLGIVLLLTGLVLLGNFAYKNWIREMPNGVRLCGLFLCAGVLMET
ncbi:MAG: hypothetical protein EOP87_14805, partial [Verrucomicrobiaceae bacterium]